MRAMPVAAAVCLLLVPVRLRGDTFSDFRIPRHSWFSLSASLSGSARPSSGHDGSIDSKLGSLSGGLSGSGWWFLDSDKRRDFLAVAVLTSGTSVHFSTSRAGLDFLSIPFSQSRDSKSRSATEAWSIATELRRYPWRTPFGLVLRAAGTGDYAQRWSREDLQDVRPIGAVSVRSEQSSGMSDWLYFYQVSEGASAGYGRVRDATAVYLAYLLERRLQQDRALSRPLSNAAREKIAALYYIGPTYGTAHDRPSRFFWRDLERILSEDGALGEKGLDAYSLFHADEPYAFVAPNSRGSIRQVGWYSGFALAGDHIHYIDRLNEQVASRQFNNDTLMGSATFSHGERRESSSDRLLVGGEAELHRPLGLRWQGDVTGRVLFPTRHVPHGIDVASSASLAYLVADRWSASGFVLQSRSIYEVSSSPVKGLGGSSWEVGYGVEVAFYVEDRVKLTLSARESQAAQRPSPSFLASERQYRREAAILLGVSYQFLGGLDAPGLIEPVRLLPPSRVPY